MYLQHFGLTEFPFKITPDPSFAFSAEAHQGALNTLLVALQCGEGFLKITGEVGTGKTLLCRRLLGTLGDEWVSAYLPNPSIDANTLLLALAEELGIEEATALDSYHLLRRINLALLHFARDKKRVIVCIDEAQAMPLATLEALRLVSNLETEKRKLIQIVIFGQPELDKRLADPSARQLLQRITFHYHLDCLEKSEIELYLNHRLRVAGYRADPVFSSAALRALRRASGGVPRLLNILAHKSLLAAFGEGRRHVELPHVRQAAKDTDGARHAGWW